MKILTIKNNYYWINITTVLLLCMVFTVAQAAQSDDAITKSAEPQAQSQQLIVHNPTENYGIKVGDQLVRTLTIEVPAAYQLTKKSLPKKGSNVEGIELVSVKVDEEKIDQIKHYEVSLGYQVFVNPGAPQSMQLPKLTIPLEGGKQAKTLTIPAWQFWFAPLVVGEHQTASKAIQADIMPPLLDTQAHKVRMITLLVIAALALLALLYMNADGHWLPLMGGAFAQAHRRLKKLANSKQTKTAKEEKQALVYLHQAFNKHFGANIFARDIAQFIKMKPAFASMQAEIKQFFDHSNQSLYDTKPRDSAQVILKLVQLSKALRDCERGV